jgi:hypothetical protein
MITEFRSSARDESMGDRQPTHAVLRAAWRSNDQGQLEIGWRTELAAPSPHSNLALRSTKEMGV